MSEAELAAFDIAGMLVTGLSGDSEAVRRDLFGIGAVGAAVVLDRAGTQPRSVAYLADVVRAGGCRFAAELEEPLPEPAQAVTVRPWLRAVVGVAESVNTDDLLADWLRAVATILAVRRLDRTGGFA
ncbi:hypothetical protein [Nocardia blacklockiae]|uniref:hypothetical protein n=1 Tax=Nocardia blacklockiae TaxID=480036 RepID=UPI001E4322BB|nr:hypothetical protein [Nocardia blacklockiae]